MKTLYFLSFCIIIALSSCSSSHQSASSDDTYYSQGRQTTTSNASSNEFDYYNTNSSDRYLAMRVQDPDRWSTFDDYDYGYAGSRVFLTSSYGLDGYYPWNATLGLLNLYSPYYMYNYYNWNCFYNPYYGGPVVIGNSYAMSGAYNQLHPFNVTGYSNRVINNANLRNSRFYTPTSTTRNIVNNNLYRSGNNNSGLRRTYYNNQQQNSNSYRRNYYSNQQQNNNSNYRQQNNPQQSQPSRSFSPAPVNSGGGGGGVSRGSFGHH